MFSRTAICRGAVYKGFIDGLDAVGEERPSLGYKIDMPITVISTISRASYGIKFSEEFEEGKHLEEDKKWDPEEGKLMAKSQMKWYLKKVWRIFAALRLVISNDEAGR